MEKAIRKQIRKRVERMRSDPACLLLGFLGVLVVCALISIIIEERVAMQGSRDLWEKCDGDKSLAALIPPQCLQSRNALAKGVLLMSAGRIKNQLVFFVVGLFSSWISMAIILVAIFLTLYIVVHRFMDLSHSSSSSHYNRPYEGTHPLLLSYQPTPHSVSFLEGEEAPRKTSFRYQ